MALPIRATCYNSGVLGRYFGPICVFGKNSGRKGPYFTEAGHKIRLRPAFPKNKAPKCRYFSPKGRIRQNNAAKGRYFCQQLMGYRDLSD